MTRRLLIYSAGVFVWVVQIGSTTAKLKRIGPVAAKQTFAQRTKSLRSKSSLCGVKQLFAQQSKPSGNTPPLPSPGLVPSRGHSRREAKLGEANLLGDKQCMTYSKKIPCGNDRKEECRLNHCDLIYN